MQDSTQGLGGVPSKTEGSREGLVARATAKFKELREKIERAFESKGKQAVDSQEMVESILRIAEKDIEQLKAQNDPLDKAIRTAEQGATLSSIKPLLKSTIEGSSLEAEKISKKTQANIEAAFKEFRQALVEILKAPTEPKKENKQESFKPVRDPEEERLVELVGTLTIEADDKAQAAYLDTLEEADKRWKEYMAAKDQHDVEEKEALYKTAVETAKKAHALYEAYRASKENISEVEEEKLMDDVYAIKSTTHIMEHRELVGLADKLMRLRDKVDLSDDERREREAAAKELDKKYRAYELLKLAPLKTKIGEDDEEGIEKVPQKSKEKNPNRLEEIRNDLSALQAALEEAFGGGSVKTDAEAALSLSKKIIPTIREDDGLQEVKTSIQALKALLEASNLTKAADKLAKARKTFYKASDEALEKLEVLISEAPKKASNQAASGPSLAELMAKSKNAAATKKATPVTEGAKQTQPAELSEEAKLRLAAEANQRAEKRAEVEMAEIDKMIVERCEERARNRRRLNDTFTLKDAEKIDEATLNRLILEDLPIHQARLLVDFLDGRFEMRRLPANETYKDTKVVGHDGKVTNAKMMAANESDPDEYKKYAVAESRYSSEAVLRVGKKLGFGSEQAIRDMAAKKISTEQVGRTTEAAKGVKEYEEREHKRAKIESLGNERRKIKAEIDQTPKGAEREGLIEKLKQIDQERFKLIEEVNAGKKVFKDKKTSAADGVGAGENNVEAKKQETKEEFKAAALTKAKEKPGWINQDAYLINEKYKLYGVFDGVGGAKGGTEASTLGVEYVNSRAHEFEGLNAKQAKRKMEEIMDGAAKKLNEAKANDPELKDMATTATLIVFVDGQMVVGGAGDSRLYAELADGTVEALTLDDNQILDRAAIDFGQGEMITAISALVDQCESLDEWNELKTKSVAELQALGFEEAEAKQVVENPAKMEEGLDLYFWKKERRRTALRGQVVYEYGTEMLEVVRKVQKSPEEWEDLRNKPLQDLEAAGFTAEEASTVLEKKAEITAVLNIFNQIPRLALEDVSKDLEGREKALTLQKVIDELDTIATRSKFLKQSDDDLLRAGFTSDEIDAIRNEEDEKIFDYINTTSLWNDADRDEFLARKKGEPFAKLVEKILQWFENSPGWEEFIKQDDDQLKALKFDDKDIALIREYPDAFKFYAVRYFLQRNEIAADLGNGGMAFAKETPSNLKNIYLFSDKIHDNLKRTEIRLLITGNYDQLGDKEIADAAKTAKTPEEALMIAADVRSKQKNTRSKPDDGTVVRVQRDIVPVPDPAPQAQPAVSQTATPSLAVPSPDNGVPAKDNNHVVDPGVAAGVTQTTPDMPPVSEWAKFELRTKAARLHLNEVKESIKTWDTRTRGEKGKVIEELVIRLEQMVAQDEEFIQTQNPTESDRAAYKDKRERLAGSGYFSHLYNQLFEKEGDAKKSYFGKVKDSIEKETAKPSANWDKESLAQWYAHKDALEDIANVVKTLLSEDAAATADSSADSTTASASPDAAKTTAPDQEAAKKRAAFEKRTKTVRLLLDPLKLDVAGWNLASKELGKIDKDVVKMIKRLEEIIVEDGLFLQNSTPTASEVAAYKDKRERLVGEHFLFLKKKLFGDGISTKSDLNTLSQDIANEEAKPFADQDAQKLKHLNQRRDALQKIADILAVLDEKFTPSPVAQPQTTTAAVVNTPPVPGTNPNTPANTPPAPSQAPANAPSHAPQNTSPDAPWSAPHSIPTFANPDLFREADRDLLLEWMTEQGPRFETAKKIAEKGKYEEARQKYPHFADHFTLFNNIVEVTEQLMGAMTAEERLAKEKILKSLREKGPWPLAESAQLLEDVRRRRDEAAARLKKYEGEDDGTKKKGKKKKDPEKMKQAKELFIQLEAEVELLEMDVELERVLMEGSTLEGKSTKEERREAEQKYAREGKRWIDTNNEAEVAQQQMSEAMTNRYVYAESEAYFGPIFEAFQKEQEATMALNGALRRFNIVDAWETRLTQTLRILDRQSSGPIPLDVWTSLPVPVSNFLRNAGEDAQSGVEKIKALLYERLRSVTKEKVDADQKLKQATQTAEVLREKSAYRLAWQAHAKLEREVSDLAREMKSLELQVADNDPKKAKKERAFYEARSQEFATRLELTRYEYERKLALLADATALVSLSQKSLLGQTQVEGGMAMDEASAFAALSAQKAITEGLTRIIAHQSQLHSQDSLAESRQNALRASLPNVPWVLGGSNVFANKGEARENRTSGSSDKEKTLWEQAQGWPGVGSILNAGKEFLSAFGIGKN